MMAGPENKTTHQRGNTHSQDSTAYDKDLVFDDSTDKDLVVDDTDKDLVVDDIDITKDKNMKGHMVDVPGDSVDEDSGTADVALSARLSGRRVGVVDSPIHMCSGRIPVRETGSSQRHDSDADRDVFEEVTSERIFFVEDSDSDDEVKESVFTSRTDDNIVTPKSDTYDERLSGGLTGDVLSGSETFDFKPKSKSIPIPIDIPASISSLSASCRRCHSQVVVLCQLSPGGSSMPHAFSYPAFSPKWKDVVTLPTRSPRPPTQHDRLLSRRYTVSNCAEVQEQQSKKMQREKKVDQAADQEWMHHHAQAFIHSRSRSHSDTDVNYHMMKEVGRELRRMSDDFHFSYTGRPLKTVRESSEVEEEEAISNLHPSSCP